MTDYFRLTAPCGKDCFNCPAYTGKENEENRNTFLKRLNLDPEKFACPGCRDNKGECPTLALVVGHSDCKIYKCVSKQGVDFCYNCSSFPCDYLQPVADRGERIPHAMKIFNLCMIQRHGLDEWASKHAKRQFQRFYTAKLDDCM